MGIRPREDRGLDSMEFIAGKVSPEQLPSAIKKGLESRVVVRDRKASRVEAA